MRRPSAAIIGLGSHLPATVVTNADLAQTFDTTDEWISSRTGIQSRYWAGPGCTTGDLAVQAGHAALRSAGLDRVSGAVDAVIVATSTPDHPIPATAPSVASRLGLGLIAAYDISAVCSGFVYALATAAAHIAAEQARRVLVIGADTYSTILDPDDRTTSVIFGDGAGAVVLEAVENPDTPGVVLGVDLGSDGSHADLIRVPGGGSQQRAYPDEADLSSPYFAMQGKEVFTAAVSRMVQSTEALLVGAGWTLPDVDRVVGHQANARILRAVARELGVPEERMVVHLDRVGNTSAASIPLALADACTSGRLTPGQRVVLTAFGGGLTWGSAALTWPHVDVV